MMQTGFRRSCTTKLSQPSRPKLHHCTRKTRGSRTKPSVCCVSSFIVINECNIYLLRFRRSKRCQKCDQRAAIFYWFAELPTAFVSVTAAQFSGLIMA